MIRAGQKLQEERVSRGLTLVDVSLATKIKVTFLSAVEKGDYKKLPSRTYAHGFIRNYARFLGLPENELLALFKREYDEDKFQKIMPEALLIKDDFPLSKFKFTQAFKVITLVFFALLVYIVFQYRAAIFNPSLSVSFPKENQVVSSQTVTVVGHADSDSTVFVNDEIVSLDKDGNFKKTINVFPGKTKIVVKAINNFNKTTILQRHIEVKNEEKM